jgi:AraC-like DNA-binding protein
MDPAPNTETALSTFGNTPWPNYEFSLVFDADETLSPLRGRGTRFRLILIDRGTGILAYDGRRAVFSAPALFCLSETEEVTLVQSQGFHAQTIYFHPDVVHTDLNFDNVRSKGQFGWSDQMWLRPFIAREEGWTGCARLGPAAFTRVSGLFAAIGRELAAQRDGFWPCRSRSFFLEILFLLERVSTVPGEAEEELLADDPSLNDVEPVLLYLHNHYGEKLSLEGLAREFHTNRTTLSKNFHAKTGLPVMAYLTKLRIDLAALMLRDTRIPVGEIVARTGFASPTHFGRAFRKSTGFTPSQYRDKYCWA